MSPDSTQPIPRTLTIARYWLPVAAFVAYQAAAALMVVSGDLLGTDQEPSILMNVSRIFGAGVLICGATLLLLAWSQLIERLRAVEHDGSDVPREHSTADTDRTKPRPAPLSNRLLTNIAIPVAAILQIFAGVVCAWLFGLFVHPDTAIEGPAGSLAPWGFALLGSLAIFAGCNGVFIWHRERERLRCWRGG